jgi:hypothetical protein
MISNLFSSFDPSHKDNSDFVLDLNSLMETSPIQRDAILESLPLLVTAKTDKAIESITNDLIDKTGLNRINIKRITAFLAFFVSQLEDDKTNVKTDTADSWFLDLVSLQILKKEQSTNFISFMESTKKTIIDIILPQLKVDVYESGVIPHWTGIGTSVELRGVFDTEFRLGDVLSNFSPKLTSLSPIMSVVLTVNRGDPDRFFFQITLQQMNLLINSLEAVRKQAIILQESCKKTA